MSGHYRPKVTSVKRLKTYLAFLRECDEMPVQMILAEWMPERGLGRQSMTD